MKVTTSILFPFKPYCFIVSVTRKLVGCRAATCFVGLHRVSREVGPVYRTVDHRSNHGAYLYLYRHTMSQVCGGQLGNSILVSEVTSTITLLQKNEFFHFRLPNNIFAEN